jgi:hypothetical protein
MNLESRLEKYNHVYGSRLNSSPKKLREKSYNNNMRAMSQIMEEEKVNKK